MSELAKYQRQIERGEFDRSDYPEYCAALEAELEKEKKRLDKLDSLAKFHGPRVNFYRTGPHMDGGTVVLQIMGQREVEGVDLRDAIDGWEEPHE